MHRKATMVELHDRRVILHVDGIDGLHGFEDVPAEGDRFDIDGDGLDRIARHFGFRPLQITSEEGGKRETLGLPYSEIALVRRTGARVIGAKGSWHHITELLVRQDGEKRLNIQFTAAFDEGPAEQVELSYSGSYTVWWQKDPA